MERVLVVDFRGSVGKLALFSADGAVVAIETRVFKGDHPDYFDNSRIWSGSVGEEIHQGSQSGALALAAHSVIPTEVQSGELLVTLEEAISSLLERASSQPSKAEKKSPPAAGKGGKGAAVGRLVELFGDKTTPWDAVVALVAPKLNFSTNLTLPFAGQKQLDLLVPGEVADAVPFDLADFHLQHSVIKQLEEGGNDIFVSAVERNLITELLQSCKAAHIEPDCIITPGVLVSSVYLLSPNYLQSESAILLIDQGVLYITVVVDSQPIASRCIRLAHLIAAGSAGSFDALDSVSDLSSLDNQAAETIGSEVRRTIIAAEKRYSTKIRKIYYFGEDPNTPRLQQSIGRPLERLRYEDFVSLKGELAELGMAAPFALEDQPRPPLINYRSGEFRYNPAVQAIWRAAMSVVPYLITAAMLAGVLLLLIHQVREREIVALKKSFAKEVAAVMPEIAVPEGLELDTILAERRNLNDALDALGSRSRVSPVEALTAIARQAKDFVPDIQIEQLTMGGRGSSIIVEGSAPGYQKIEEFYTHLSQQRRSRKDKFCRVEKPKNTGNKQGNRVGFEITVNLCGVEKK